MNADVADLACVTPESGTFMLVDLLLSSSSSVCACEGLHLTLSVAKLGSSFRYEGTATGRMSCRPSLSSRESSSGKPCSVDHTIEEKSSAHF